MENYIGNLLYPVINQKWILLHVDWESKLWENYFRVFFRGISEKRKKERERENSLKLGASEVIRAEGEGSKRELFLRKGGGDKQLHGGGVGNGRLRATQRRW